MLYLVIYFTLPHDDFWKKKNKTYLQCNIQ